MDRLFQGEICRMRKTAGKGILFTVSESKLALDCESEGIRLRTATRNRQDKASQKQTTWAKYYAKNVTIFFGRRDNVNSDGVTGIGGNANRRTK
nr:Uncharacterised protein [Salmonella sp. NCTC 7297]